MRAFKSGFITIMVTVVLVVALATGSQAATPAAINIQGRLTDATGTAVPDGTYSVVFTIYDAPSSGIVKWTETQSVTTTGGLFAVVLGSYLGGSYTPIIDTVFNGSARFLGVKVGTDPELTPRTILVTAPYAFRVSTVDGATGGAISGNINLDFSTATTGNILKGGVPFIQNSGVANTFIGIGAGTIVTGTLSTFFNTACGAYALQSLNTGNYNTACGYSALYHNTDGYNNTAGGGSALWGNTTGHDNTANGTSALSRNTTGYYNTASGVEALNFDTNGWANTATGYQALYNNITGDFNAAYGGRALATNITGDNNTAVGDGADVSVDGLEDATAIGANAVVNASHKIRFGDAAVNVIEGQVAYTFTSDRNQKENFQPVDGDDVLRKISGLSLTSWNYKKQDPSRFRHYGPVAQEFFAAFGHDAVGRCGDSTSINSGDETGILMVAVQTLEKDKEQMKAENKDLRTELDGLKKMVSQLLAQSKQDGTKKYTLK